MPGTNGCAARVRRVARAPAAAGEVKVGSCAPTCFQGWAGTRFSLNCYGDLLNAQRRAPRRARTAATYMHARPCMDLSSGGRAMLAGIKCLPQRNLKLCAVLHALGLARDGPSAFVHRARRSAASTFDRGAWTGTRRGGPGGTRASEFRDGPGGWRGDPGRGGRWTGEIDRGMHK